MWWPEASYSIACSVSTSASAVQRLGLAERQLERRHAMTERLAQLGHDAFEVGAVLVLASDEEDPRQPELDALVPRHLGADLDRRRWR